MAIHQARLNNALLLIKRVFREEKDDWWCVTTRTFDKFSYNISQPLSI